MKFSKEELQKIKLKAKHEYSSEKMEKIIIELKSLYKKRDAAAKILSNINREIDDYEQHLEG